MNSEEKDAGKEEEPKFSTLSKKSKIVIVTAILLLIILAISFVIGILFFMYVGIFELLGVQYDSWSSIMLFVFLAFLFDIIFTFVLIFPKALIQFAFSKTAKWKIAVLVSILQIALEIIALHTIDNIMESVTLTNAAEVVMALILFCMDKMFPSRRRKK